MSSLKYLFLLGSILLICISFTNTALLDTACTENQKCDGVGMICEDSKCQCDTPYYTPCHNSNCNLRNRLAYEGDDCRVDGNCVENANCISTENRCRCLPDFVAYNGLCYKNLNATCTNRSQCWSHECQNNVCQCPSGFVPRDDKRRCQRKLAKIYADWTLANENGDFCYGKGDYYCLVASAICDRDSEHSERFCQCPPEYTADYVKQECHLKVYNGLSPSQTPLPSNMCGKCQANYSLCAVVANQTTCWCRAGFIKSEEQCVKSRQTLVFPNDIDIGQRDYTSNCSISKTTGLCTCASGYKYKFINQISSCELIDPQWENNEFEYGVCTRINSDGFPVQEDGLCPAPLTCQARKDKYVCSCGRDRFLDEDSNSCRYYLERSLTTPDASYCPPNSILINNMCLCNSSAIFSVSSDYQRCELVLNTTGDIPDAASCQTPNTAGNASCAQLYGSNAQFCRKGECRCSSANSYYENNTCVTLIYAVPGNKIICPPNADGLTGVCKCNDGYRVADMRNRTCVKKVNQLNETMPSDQFLQWNLTTKDCSALFPNQPVKSDNGACQCADDTFFNGTICVFYLGKPSPSSNVTQCPKNADQITVPCKCSSGYKEVNNQTCDPWTTMVYQHNETPNENKTGINDADCKAFFGSAAEISENKTYCRCRDNNTAYFDATHCYFLVNTAVGNISSESACPSNSKINGTRCECVPGYQAKSSKEGCDQKQLPFFNVQSISSTKFQLACDSGHTDIDCEALYGFGAVCRNNTCYCDRARSFVRGNRCELLSQSIFPGLHEHHLYTCESQKDCGTDAKKNGVECELIGANRYSVCRCQPGYFFNPVDSTCVQNPCYPACSNNEKCQDDQCICNDGYYKDGSEQCVKSNGILKLHGGCNRTYDIAAADEGLQCYSDCERVGCSPAYRDDGSKCVKNSFDDRCVNDESFCQTLSLDAFCDGDENKCACAPGFYQTTGSRICARAVGGSCIASIDCGEFGDCQSQICVCKNDQMEKEGIDILGRPIKTCPRVSGIDQLRINPVFLLVFIIVVHVFFA